MAERGREEKKPEKEKKVAKRGKKVRTGRKHENVPQKSIYDVKGEGLFRKKKHCPRCGPGTWLADHKTRLYCGRCGYTIFEKR